MSEDDLSIKDRLVEASKMGQEPKDRLWAAIVALVLIVFVVGGVSIAYAEGTKTYLREEHDLAFQRGSVDCLQVVIDDDRNFGLPGYCGRHEVLIHFPPEVCDTYFPEEVDCGSRWGNQ